MSVSNVISHDEEFEVQVTDSRSKVNTAVILELRSITILVLFGAEYGAEDITVLKDGLAFLSTVCQHFSIN